MIELKKVKLGEIASVTSSKRIFANEYQTEGVPFYRGKEIIEKHNGHEVTTELFITRERYEEIKSKYDVPRLGDILLSSVGTLGVPWLVDEEEFYFKDGNLTWLRCNERTISEFLYLWLNSPEAKQQIESMCIGSTQKALTIDTIKKFDVSLPPLDVQKRICSIDYPISKKIKVNNAINRNLLEQAITVFKEKIWIKDKNGTIGDYCVMKSGFAFKSSWWTEEGVKVIKIGDINQDNLSLNTCSHVDEDKVKKASDYIVKSGDLVLAMTGATIGKFAMVPERKETILVNQRVGKFFLGDEPLKKVPFIYCTLKMDDVYSEVIGRGQGSAQPNISGNDVMTIPCVIPTEEEIDAFNLFAEPIFTSIVKNQNENEQLAYLRDSILPKLMSGELDVSDIDI